ncbi:hypothetical protein C900_00283 [Fulvivirga imtechensis AK7]|uniref:Uncharacterized protein n=1 Tax=Fulvivirga imtechensis AK7 TaxID=1237149 RepID=L8JMC5_9BACT|nr:hypothetical protein C900_00283 [Fulvivirga imtechensis AK7]
MSFIHNIINFAGKKRTARSSCDNRAVNLKPKLKHYYLLNADRKNS